MITTDEQREERLDSLLPALATDYILVAIEHIERALAIITNNDPDPDEARRLVRDVLNDAIDNPPTNR